MMAELYQSSQERVNLQFTGNTATHPRSAQQTLDPAATLDDSQNNSKPLCLADNS